MKVQKRGAERGAGSFDRSLNFSGYPQNEENPRISRIAVYHCICTAPYMIRKGGRKGGRTSRTLVGPHNATVYRDREKLNVRVQKSVNISSSFGPMHMI